MTFAECKIIYVWQFCAIFGDDLRFWHEGGFYANLYFTDGPFPVFVILLQSIRAFRV